MEGRQQSKGRWERGSGERGRGGEEEEQISEINNPQNCQQPPPDAPTQSISNYVCFFLGMGKQASSKIVHIKVDLRRMNVWSENESLDLCHITFKRMCRYLF